jgi:ATP-dependent RNA helicase RhlE
LTNFESFGLNPSILKALDEAGHVMPTPIQAQAIPHVITGRDLIGIAQTGTGKTAAFALPLIDRLARAGREAPRRGCRILVLSPTRELSGQIVQSFRTYGRHLGLRVELVIGGVSMTRQIRALTAGVDVLVATPGRLLDLVAQKAVRLDGVEMLVLDEADQMLDMGFIHDIRALVARLPMRRQTLLFSATMPDAIAALSRDFLRDPVEVSVTPVARTADRVEQSVVHIEKQAKPAMLAKMLGDPAIDRVLVFARTKHGADKLVKGLAKSGIAAEAIHGNKSQGQRERALAAFRAGKVRALIATDIAARGLDIPGVSHVINYDLPNVPESYVHRIGRTARAGADGIAISFCDAEERPYLRAIEKLIRMQIRVEGASPVAGRPAAPAAGPVASGAASPPRNRDGARGAGKAASSGRGGGAQQRADRPAEHAGVGRAAAYTGSGQDIAGLPFLNWRRRDSGIAAAHRDTD